jgi:hypothetical protein
MIAGSQSLGRRANRFETQDTAPHCCPTVKSAQRADPTITRVGRKRHGRERTSPVPVAHRPPRRVRQSGTGCGCPIPRVCIPAAIPL